MSVVPRDEVDAASLERELLGAIEGEVRFDDGTRALYSTDSSNYRQIPIGVVVPRTVDDVLATIGLCRHRQAPILARGAGTSLSGQTCNVAVILDMSKYLNRVLDVDPVSRLARVQPGVVLDDLRDAAESHNLTFAPDPSTHNRCTIGGMIGNNSCGVHSVMAGKTDANIDSLDIVTYRGTRMAVGGTSERQLQAICERDGEQASIFRQLRGIRDEYREDIRTGFSNIPRRVSGFDLPYLLDERGFQVARALVGTEGTCVTVLEATVNLVPSPPSRSLVVLGYPDVFLAADAVPEVLQHKPIGLEGMDDRMIIDMRLLGLHLADLELLPEGRGWLLVEFGGESKTESDEAAKGLIRAISGAGGPTSRLCSDSTEARRLWEVRESGLGATAVVPGKFERWPGWDDSAVAPEKMGGYLRDLQSLMQQYGYDGAFYGHFGDGCLHVRYDFDLQSKPGIAHFRGFISDAADLVVSYGGSLSGEHGDGQAHGELLPKMYGPRIMEAFRLFKEAWDPDWKMNPGKVIHPSPMDQDLRLGAQYAPKPVKTAFSFASDGNSFAKATLRCAGVGKCRRHDGGLMCPSYMATREEKHSTRGRARLLFEMLNNGPIRDLWRSEEVKEALDLCLACKGCKSECPINVDMATYKAEFLSHYYSRRLRPRSAYSMGLIHWWATLGSRVPWLTNAVASNTIVGRHLKTIAGIAPQRTLPQFARTTFRKQIRSARKKPTAPLHTRGRVMLWPDTFNNHFHPETAIHAVQVLESIGFEVVLPRAALCCGRPLYDFGMLGLARSLLSRTLRELRSEIRQGTPVLVLEPSCASVFRDELLNLFPNNADASRLARQTFLLPEFLLDQGDIEWPQMEGKAVIQGHCHQRSIFGMNSERDLLVKLGLEVEVLDTGCCGMAGAFGFETEHFDVSRACAERALLPALRATPDDVFIVSDGFSCTEQIRQLSSRRSHHIADVLDLAFTQTSSYSSRRP